MISLFDRLFRKWLLRMALSVRKGAETAVLRLTPVQRETAEDKDITVISDTVKTGRFGGAPDHWVQLVKHHAPELLHPGALHTSSHGMVNNFQEQTGNDMPREILDNVYRQTHPSFRIKPSQKSGESDPPLNSWEKKPDEFPDQFSEALPNFFLKSKQQRDPTPKLSNQSDLADGRLTGKSLQKIEKKGRIKLSKLERDDSSPDFRKVLENQIKAKKPVLQESFPSFSTPDAGHFKNPRTEMMNKAKNQADPKKVSALQRKYRPVIASNLQDLDFQISRQADSKISGSRQAKGQTVFEIDSGSDVSVFSQENSMDASPQPSIFPNKKVVSDYSLLKQGSPKDARSRTVLPGNKENTEHKPASAAEFNWPGLPEENSCEDLPDPGFTAVWPSLPEEQPIDMRSGLKHMENRFTNMELREIERLQRLEVEQKGMAWSVSYF